MTRPTDEESLPSAAAVPARLHTLGLIARLWRGDGTISKLELAPRAFLLELHLLAVDQGTWPYLPAETEDLADMLHMNPRPVDGFLRVLIPAGFVERRPDDVTHLRLRDVDAVIRWRPLSDLQ